MELTGNVAGIIKLLGGGEGSTVTIEPLVTSGLQIAKVTIDEEVLYLYIPTPQNVDVDGVLTSGTKIAEISINEEDVEIYAPSPTNVSVIPALQSGTKIADISVNNVNTELYAPEGGLVNYSTEERTIGTWTDRRPLYQKTFEITAATTWGQGDNVITSIDPAFEVKKINCSVLEAGVLYDMPYIAINNAFIKAYIENGKIVFQANNTSFGIGSVANIIIEYTKSTDSSN